MFPLEYGQHFDYSPISLPVSIPVLQFYYVWLYLSVMVGKRFNAILADALLFDPGKGFLLSFPVRCNSGCNLLIPRFLRITAIRQQQNIFTMIRLYAKQLKIPLFAEYEDILRRSDPSQIFQSSF